MVLMVLAGVLAMHALGGGSHMTMASAAEAGSQGAPSVVAGGPTASVATAMAGMTPAQVAAPTRTDRAAAPLAAATHAAAGVGAACVAVLVALALVVVHAAAGAAPAPHAPAGSTGHSSAPLGRGPPRELLAQICVLRT